MAWLLRFDPMYLIDDQRKVHAGGSTKLILTPVFAASRSIDQRGEYFSTWGADAIGNEDRDRAWSIGGGRSRRDRVVSCSLKGDDCTVLTVAQGSGN